MKKLIDFNEFRFEQIVEEAHKGILEAKGEAKRPRSRKNQMPRLRVSDLELILSAKLKLILKDIKHQIAFDLLAAHIDSERVFKKTFVDVGPEPNQVTCLSSNKVPDLIEPDIVHGPYNRNPKFQLPPRGNQPDTRQEDEKSLGDFDFVDGNEYINPWVSDSNHVLDLHEIQFTNKNHPVWTSPLRVPVRVTAFINQMFPGIYPPGATEDEKAVKGYIPNDVESFNNMYVAAIEANSKMVVPVTGEDIRKFYNCNTYQKQSGTLGSSCMRDSSKSRYMDIYVKNPDKVQMLVLYPEGVRDKIIGRAILWKLDKISGKKVEDQYFMDRIYFTVDSDQQIFKDYAKNKGYYYKSRQSYDDNIAFVKPDGETENLNVEVKLKVDKDIVYYPYMDTMKYYNPKTGWITNNNGGYESGTHGQLQSTGGGISFY